MTARKLVGIATAGLLLSACQAEPETAGLDTQYPTLSVAETGIEHEPIGNARVHQENGKVYVTGVNSLDDGVRSLTAVQAPGWDGGLELSEHASAIQLIPVSSALPNNGIPAGLLLSRVEGDQWTAEPSFPSQTYRMDVYRESRLVGSINPGDGAARLRFNPRGIKLAQWRDEEDPPLRQLCFFSLLSNRPVLTVAQGERRYIGDEIQFVEQESHERYAGVDSIEVRSDADFALASEAFLF